MKILLTGPNGNLGQALQKHGRSHEWIGLSREQWPELTKRLKGVKIIIHAAADNITPLWQDPRRVIESNISPTVLILETLSQHPVDRLVFISSCAVYGRSEITQEETPPSPISVNGISKLLNEEIIREFCRRQGINYQILRIFNTYGGQDRFSIISHLQRSLRNQQPFTMNNNGISQRDFIHVDDIAEVILSLLEKPIAHPIMNVGSGEATRVRDIITAFKSRNPKLKIEHAERPEAEYSRADIAKLRQILPDHQFREVLDFIKTDL